ncbi:NFX1-type zinc finger-containing protein 1-like protein [Leptotrombidium deliense]|uniref:NFX1-type zinc finger-containing protein 1-like protein n=1 Tax=Leptotrombidium deliense TaxID=299467 RepID=A0A443SQF9_9ACAR|nr:NFX1-type zinc finger-containing protein 1-like protein [Leptotrombidium deliense]
MIGADNEDLFVDLFALADSKKYVAVESVTYYEAYRHSLQCLKDFNQRKTEFPFKDYIVDVSMSVSSPLYLQEPAIYNLTSTAECLRKDQREGYADSALRKIRSSQLDQIDITKHATEIPWDLMDLDESQFHAFHAALTRKFVVIQGPPGTGKTYTALRIVQALLDNRKHWCGTDDPDFSCPILILSYKNHALDQFLEGIARFQFDRQIIRVGGNTKSEVIKRMSLYERRKQWEEILQNYYKRHEQLDSFGQRIVRMVPSREFRRQRYIPFLMKKLFSQLEKMIVSYKQIKLGYKFAGLDIYPFVCELDFNVSVQLGFAKHSLSVDKQREAEIDRELSRNIMEWLEIDDLIDINEYMRVTMEMVNQSIQRKSSKKNTKNGHQDLESANDVVVDDKVVDEIEIVDEIDAKGQPTARNLQDQRQIDPDEYIEHPEIASFGAGLFLDVDFEEELRSEISEKRRQAIQAAKEISDRLQHDDCMDEAEAENIKNVKKLNIKDRWRLYRYFLQKYFAAVRERFDKVHSQIKLLHQELNSLKIKFDHRICREAWVVGMTTTGAAKYRKLVEFLKPKIVIVEEAAEILEAHVVSILTSYTQHLILIGDHQQLRPIPGVQELATKYQMDISLFERMVINGMTCFQLQNQHRMRPEISSLIRGHIYNKLNDHPSVHKRVPIPYTCGKNVFFFNHNEKEDKRGPKHGYSTSNTVEAEFTVELARYFVLRNVDPSKITILTTYNAQLEKIKNIIQNNYYKEFVHKPKYKNGEIDSKSSKPEFKIRISSVDGFQGEENDIIIISFVRSNDRDDIGFLDIPNRVCVALSRARRGLFCFGNFDSMKRKSELWKKICHTLEEQKGLGTELRLGCKCKKKPFKKPQMLRIFNGLIDSHYALCHCKQ